MPSDFTWKSHVYRESAEWDKYDLWYMAPHSFLREHYVCSYECAYEERERVAGVLHDTHPNCCLVY